MDIVSQIFVTAEVEALAKFQILELDVDPELAAEADHQLVYSAVSNLIQNALKFTREGVKFSCVQSLKVKISLLKLKMSAVDYQIGLLFFLSPSSSKTIIVGG